MRAILIIVLLWVVAVLFVHSWQLFVRSISNNAVDDWRNNHEESLRKDFPRE